jgi:capsular polysaccharide biosynthesis protein
VVEHRSAPHQDQPVVRLKGPGPRRARAFSCFVDHHPVLQAQAFIWVNCLTCLQHVDPADIFIHATQQIGSELRVWLAHQRVNIIDTEPFDGRNPYCNKLAQLPTFSGGDFGQVVLMDCDTAWVGGEDLPAGLPVAARIVDHAVPAPQVLESIFNASGLGAPVWRSVVFPQGDHDITDLNNCNGGVYICSGEFISELAPRWKHWALWCLDNNHLFGQYATHADQVGFALAMRELGEKVHPLEIRWNYPTHLPTQQLPDITPQIIHYHREMTNELRLKTVGVPAVDDSIEELNQYITGWMRDNTVYTTFWNFHYAVGRSDDIGHDPVGAALETKRQLISAALGSLEDCLVVDVGCGDLELTRHLGISKYLGLDIAETAIALSREKRPDWSFRLTQRGDAIPHGDVVLCVDVLTQQPDEYRFFDLIGRLALATGHRLIATGYEAPPEAISDLTQYHVPITDALRWTGQFAEIEVIGHYGDITAVAAHKANEPRPDETCRQNKVADLVQRMRDAGLADFNALLTFKRDLIESLGIEEAFRTYGTLQVPDSDHLALARVKSQFSYAKTLAEHFVEIEPGGATFTMPPPTVVGTQQAPELTNTARSLYVACLGEARVRGRSAVIEVDGAALFDFQGDELKQYGDDIDLDPAVFAGNKELVWLIEPRDDLDTVSLDSAFTLLGLNTGSFGDWMMYFLPKYVAAEMSGLLPKVPILMPAEIPETILQCLRLMAPPEAEIVQLPTFVTARVRHLWCVSSLGRAELRENLDGGFDFGSLAPPPERFARVVQEIARRGRRALDGEGGPERVVLARKGTRWRRLLNDDKIYAIARKYNFVAAYPEDLTFVEQIKLVSNARFIIVPEGSAISLCYFAPKHVKVLLLGHSRFAGVALYNVLLGALEADITVIAGPVAQAYGPHAIRSDYSIDETLFENFLASAFGDGGLVSAAALCDTDHMPRSPRRIAEYEGAPVTEIPRMIDAMTADRASSADDLGGRRLLGEPIEELVSPIIAVLGMHRSGTSLCAHILSVLGVDMTDDVDAQSSNEKGQWERLELRELHDRILGRFNRGYYGAGHDLPLPAGWWADPGVRELREAIVAFLRRRMRNGAAFGFKDPRTTRLLPVWRQIFDELQLAPKIVLCLRNPAQVARSLAARDGLPPEAGECRWFCYMTEMLGNLPDDEVCVIEYEDWFRDPSINLQKLRVFLGLPADRRSTELDAAVSQIIDPYLRHDEPGLTEPRLPLVRALYSLARDFPRDGSSRENLRELIDQFAGFREVYRPLCSRLEDIATTAAAARSEFEAALAQRDASLAETGRRNAELAAALAAKEAALAELEAGFAQLRDQLTSQQAAAAELSATLAEVTEDRDTARQTAAQLEEIAEVAQSAIDTLRDRLAQAEGERDVLRGVVARLEEERNDLTVERDELTVERDELTAERDHLMADGENWVDAAIFSEAQRVARSRRRRGWRLGRYVLHMAPARGRGSPMYRADRARAAREWQRAARFYVDALAQLPGKHPAIWVQLGHALKEAGRPVAAEFAYRQAVALDERNAAALVPLGQILRQQGRDDEAVAVYRRALELALPGDQRAFAVSELTALAQHAGAPERE